MVGINLEVALACALGQPLDAHPQADTEFDLDLLDLFNDSLGG